MKPDIHTALRSLAMAASVIMVPMAANLCHTFAVQVSREYSHWDLGKVRLPALTQFLIIDQARSSMIVFIALGVALVLILAATGLSRLPNGSPWKGTGQVFLTILGPILACLMFASTLIATLMAMIVIHSASK